MTPFLYLVALVIAIHLHKVNFYNKCDNDTIICHLVLAVFIVFAPITVVAASLVAVAYLIHWLLFEKIIKLFQR